MKRQLIIRVFYICVNGYSIKMTKEMIYRFMQDYKIDESELPEDIAANYYFQDIWLPTRNETKVEILYPTDSFFKKYLFNLEKLKEKIKEVNNEIEEKISEEKSINLSEK